MDAMAPPAEMPVTYTRLSCTAYWFLTLFKMPISTAGSPVPRSWFSGNMKFQQRMGLAVTFWRG